jgi:tRNA pseudouridine55 synthase
MDGILNIDKPAGKTSYGVVAMVKRLSGERRVGHAGTLDPAATGVLPVCLGQATRVVEFLVPATKTYRAEIELGIATDTFDASGTVTLRVDPSSVDLNKFQSALASFRGPIQQTPPMYSALKHRGQPLYKLARAGINVERRSRTVTVHRLELVSWQPPVVALEIECSKGTYVRSLAHDLGQALGCGAHLKGLVRTRCGIFGIEDAVSLARLEEVFRRGDWQRFLYPVDSVLQDFDAVVVDDAAVLVIKNGQPIAIEDSHAVDTDKIYRRAYSRDGSFLGLLRYVPDKGLWQPKKVFGLKAKPMKLVSEDKYGAYLGVTPTFLKEFVPKEMNPNFEVFDSKDGRRRFIAVKSSRMPDDQDLPGGKYGINFHRARPDWREANRYYTELSQCLITSQALGEMAFAAASKEEYNKKSAVWDKFYSYVWGETPRTIWVSPHSGSVNRTPDDIFPYPKMEMDAYAAGIAARCAYYDAADTSKRTMISIHSHNWLSAVLDLGGFGNCDQKKLENIAGKIERKYTEKIQSLAEGCRQDFLFKVGRWLEHIIKARGTLNPQKLPSESGVERSVIYFATTGLKLYKKEIKHFTLEEFKEAIQSLDSAKIRVVSCNHLFPGKQIGRQLELSGKINHGLLHFALQIECMKYYLKKAPELVSDIILDVKNALIRE